MKEKLLIIAAPVAAPDSKCKPHRNGLVRLAKRLITPPNSIIKISLNNKSANWVYTHPLEFWTQKKDTAVTV